MNIKDVEKKVKELRSSSKKRNFPQTFDLIVNLQNLDLKRPDHKVDLGINLQSNIKAKKLKICAVIDHGISDAEAVFDKVIYVDELASLKGNMKEIRKITHEFDKFVVQSNHMAVFAQLLGRYLGPMGKMPSPKLGMVIGPKTVLSDLYDKIQKTVHFQTRKNLVLQSAIGSELDSDELVAKNIIHVYESLIHSLPNHEHNIKNFGLKLTMSSVVVL